jgi:hypothetical protein
MITFGTMRGGVSQMMFSRDGSHLFMAGIRQPAFESPDRTMAAAAGSHNTVAIWDLEP